MSIKLRKLIKSDSIEMIKFNTDHDLIKYVNFIRKKPIINDYLRFVSKANHSKIHRHYAIDLNVKYIGTISLKNINYHKRIGELAIAIIKDYRGKGYGKKAIFNLIQIAKSKLKLFIIKLNVFEHNLNSVNPYERIGFHKYFVSNKMNFYYQKKVPLLWMKKELL
jgi:RimJ/RimL family protein N-acetyltransferase